VRGRKILMNEEDKRHKRILIADDDEVCLKMVKAILIDAGYTVYAATNGMDAVRIAKDKIPDLIITDIMMPGIDGGEVVNILRSEITTQHIPVFFLSSLIQEGEEKCTTKEEITCYVAKPLNRKELLKRIEDYLGDR